MKIAIIGGGAAGMMAAATINENNPKAEVFLIEKNASLGKKVIISGGGRCNVTTGLQDVQAILGKYPRGGKFLNSAIRQFSPQNTRDWFENHGVPLKCENDMRVFPISNNGKDVVKAFEKVFKKYKTNILFNHQVTKVKRLHKSAGFIINFKTQKALQVDKVILTLGGQAYRQTGSTGDGYSLAENLGHHITELAPSLSSLISKEKWPTLIAGLSFSKATFSAKTKSPTGRVNKYSFTGPFVFTHWGISGPAVFALSSLIAFETFSPNQQLKITIDLLPDLKIEKIITDLKKFIKNNPNKLFKHTLQQFIPLSMATVVIEQVKIDIAPSTSLRAGKKNNAISNKELNQTANWLKNIPLTITDRKAGDEFVTAGGVDLAEVNPSTMESKICPNLYFAGEILNIDGFTGGFNLQASWATGHLAGLNSCK